MLADELFSFFFSLPTGFLTFVVFFGFPLCPSYFAANTLGYEAQCSWHANAYLVGLTCIHDLVSLRMYVATLLYPYLSFVTHHRKRMSYHLVTMLVVIQTLDVVLSFLFFFR